MKIANQLLSAYKKVQRFAPAAGAQTTDDVWDEITHLAELRDQRATEHADKLVKPRRRTAE